MKEREKLNAAASKLSGVHTRLANALAALTEAQSELAAVQLGNLPGEEPKTPSNCCWCGAPAVLGPCGNAGEVLYQGKCTACSAAGPARSDKADALRLWERYLGGISGRKLEKVNG